MTPLEMYEGYVSGGSEMDGAYPSMRFQGVGMTCECRTGAWVKAH